MKNSAVVPRIYLSNGRPVTTSLNVAEVFGKQHSVVLRTIRSLDVPDGFSACNFAPASYIDEQGKPRPMHTITRDGFTLLAMGFTGSAAMRFKLAYIESFNRMEAELHDQAALSARRRTDIHHHRGPVSPASGLDIRYTVDLTKIVTRPTKSSLAMLHLLTGLNVDDVADGLVDLRPGTEQEDLVRAFLADCTVAAPGSLTKLPALLRVYHRWYADTCPSPAAYTLTGRSLASILRSLGQNTTKKGGSIFVSGLALTREVAV